MPVLSLSPVQTGRWSTTNTNWQATFAAGTAANRPTMRFEVAVPRGATINTATITFTRGGSATPALTMCAWDTDHVGVLADPVDKSHPTLTDGSASGLGSNSYDVAALLQTIVNRTGWASGNGVAFWLNVPSTPAATVTFSSVSLTVDYTTPVILVDGVSAPVSGVAGAVQVVQPVEAQTDTVSTVDGVVDLNPGQAGTVNAVTATAATVKRIGRLDGTATATTTAVADPASTQQVTGTVTGTSTVTLHVVVPAPTPWQVAVTLPAWAELLEMTEWTTDARVDVIDAQDTTVTLPGLVRSCQVKVDADTHVTWSGSVTVGVDLLPQSPRDPLHPLAYNRVRPVWMVRMPDGTWQDIPVGTMYVTDIGEVRDDGTDVTVDLTLGDAIELVKTAGWDTGISLGGVEAGEAIRRIILDRAPIVNAQIPTTGFVLPDTWEAGEPGGDPWDDVVKIADAAGLIVGTDRMGVIVARERPTTGRTVADFTEGDGCTVTDISAQTPALDLKNIVTVVTTSRDVDPPLLGRAEDTDPTSPLFVGRGVKRTLRVQSDTATTQAQVDQLAGQRLADSRSLTTLIELSHRPRPDLDVWDVVTVQRARIGVAGAAQIRAWTLDLAPGSLQKTTLSAPRRLDAF